MLGWHGRDPHVDRLMLDLDGETSILRQALFGDIEPRHQLQTQGQRRCDFDVRFGLQMQHAIDSEADLQPPLLRFDMDIRSTYLHRIVEYRLQQFDDGRFFQAGSLSQRAKIDVAVAEILLQFARKIRNLFGTAIDAVDALQQFAFVDHRKFDRPFYRTGNFVIGEQIGRVGHPDQ